MRVLVLGGEGMGEGVAAALAGVGGAVAVSRAVNPDLDGCDLVHLIAAVPWEDAARRFFHARRWGRPVVVTVVGESGGEPLATPAGRYERGLRGLIARGAAAVAPAEAGGEALAGIYAMVAREGGAMGESGAGQWVPDLSAEDYGKHLEDLVQLQLELIAFRDVEYEQVCRERDAARAAAGRAPDADEHARLVAWARDLAAQHAALQAEHARLQGWAGELEARARGGRRAGVGGVIGRLWRRG